MSSLIETSLNRGQPKPRTNLLSNPVFRTPIRNLYQSSPRKQAGQHRSCSIHVGLPDSRTLVIRTSQGKTSLKPHHSSRPKLKLHESTQTLGSLPSCICTSVALFDPFLKVVFSLWFNLPVSSKLTEQELPVLNSEISLKVPATLAAIPTTDADCIASPLVSLASNSRPIGL